MRYFRLLIVFFGIFTAFNLFADDCASITVYRPSKIVGATVGVKLYINNEEVATLKNDSKIKIDVNASGTYLLSARWGTRGENYRERSEQEINLQCGEAKFALIDVNAIVAESFIRFEDEKDREKHIASIPEEKSHLTHFGAKPSNAIPNQSRQQNTSSSNGCTKLIAYRPKRFTGSSFDVSIFINDKEVGQLKNNATLEINFNSAGLYKITAKWGSKSEQYRKRTETILSLECKEETYLLIDLGAVITESFLRTESEKDRNDKIAKIPSSNTSNITYDIPEKVVQNKSNKVAINNNSKKESPVQGTTQKQRSGSDYIAGNTDQLEFGTSYALIIGVDDYIDNNIIDLDQPIADAQKLYDILTQNYTFSKANIRFLKNPTRNEITQSLDYFYENTNDNDNLLIFYAGHGYWDEQFQQGYWLAADADKNNRGTWLSNGTLRDYMRAIPARHSLLVTDACFGGGIFKSRSAFSNSSAAINQMYKLPSRKAMTSGALSEVPDKSVFIKYLVKRLSENQEKYLSSEQLFASFKIAVINNSPNGQVPQFGEVQETGDEGGDYIFIKK